MPPCGGTGTIVTSSADVNKTKRFPGLSQQQPVWRAIEPGLCARRIQQQVGENREIDSR
jgi:hypothetical protein